MGDELFDLIGGSTMARCVREKRRYLWLVHQAQAGDRLHHGRSEMMRACPSSATSYRFELVSYKGVWCLEKGGLGASGTAARNRFQ